MYICTLRPVHLRIIQLNTYVVDSGSRVRLLVTASGSGFSRLLHVTISDTHDTITVDVLFTAHFEAHVPSERFHSVVYTLEDTTCLATAPLPVDA